MAGRAGARLGGGMAGPFEPVPARGGGRPGRGVDADRVRAPRLDSPSSKPHWSARRADRVRLVLRHAGRFADRGCCCGRRGAAVRPPWPALPRDHRLSARAGPGPAEHGCGGCGVRVRCGRPARPERRGDDSGHFPCLGGDDPGLCAGSGPRTPCPGDGDRRGSRPGRSACGRERGTPDRGGTWSGTSRAVGI